MIVIDSKAAVTSSFVDSTPRSNVIGLWGIPPTMSGSNLSDFGFKRSLKNYTHRTPSSAVASLLNANIL